MKYISVYLTGATFRRSSQRFEDSSLPEEFDIFETDSLDPTTNVWFNASIFSIYLCILMKIKKINEKNRV